MNKEDIRKQMILSAGSPSDDPNDLFTRASKAFGDEAFSDALALAMAAAEKGHNEAYLLAGKCFLKGLGTEQDTSKAVSSFEIAAAGGHAEAKMMLASLCLSGDAPSVSHEKAAQFAEDAAQADVAGSHALLGQIYMEGRGVNKDAHKAADLFHKAIEKGDVNGILATATLYAKGLGVSKDLNKAYELAKDAQNRGHQAAQELVAEIRDELWGKPNRSTPKSLVLAMVLAFLLGPIGLFYLDAPRALFAMAAFLLAILVLNSTVVAFACWFLLPVVLVLMLGTNKRSFKSYWSRFKRKRRF